MRKFIRPLAIMLALVVVGILAWSAAAPIVTAGSAPEPAAPADLDVEGLPTAVAPALTERTTTELVEAAATSPPAQPDVVAAPLPPAPPAVVTVSLPLRDRVQGLSVSPHDADRILVWDNYLSLSGTTEAGISWVDHGRRQGNIFNAHRQAQWSADGRIVFVPGIGNAWFGWVSTDHGENFRQLPCPWVDEPGQPFGIYQRILTADGNLVAGWRPLDKAMRDQPVRLITSEDAGATWTTLRDLDPGRSYSLHPVARGFAVAYCTHEEMFISIDGGRAFIPSGTGLGDLNIGEPWFHRDGVLHFMAGDGTRLLTFDAATRAWTGRPLRIPGAGNAEEGYVVTGFVVDPHDHQRMHVLGPAIGLLRTLDGGVTWQRSTQTYAPACTTIDHLPGTVPGIAVAGAGRLLLLRESGPDAEALWRPAGRP